MNRFQKTLLPILILFVVFCLLIVVAKPLCIKYLIDRKVLIAANLLFLLLSLAVFFLQKKALQNANPNVFVRSIIAGMMIKMFSTAIAVLAYVLIVGNSYNTAAVFISLIMYLIYLAAEVYAISKLNKKNA